MKRIILLGVLFLLFAGCVEEESLFDERVFGSWEEFQGSEFTFNKNGELVEFDGSSSAKHTYWFENETLVINWGIDNIIIYDYEIMISGNYEFLVLKVNGEDRMIMHRIVE